MRIALYYDWWLAYNQKEIAETLHKENLKLLNNIKEKYNQKIADKADLNKIELQVYDKKDNVTIKENTYKNYYNLIKNAILEQDSDTLYHPVKPECYQPCNIEFDSSYEQFKNESRTFDIMNLESNKNINEIDIFSNNIKPSFDLIFSYNVSGGKSYFEDPDHYIKTGFSLSFPSARTCERAQLETAKIEKQLQDYSRQNTKLNLYITLKNLYNDIVHTKKLIDTAEKKIQLAEEIVEKETKNYQYGRITLNQLISEINDVENKKLNKTIYEVELLKQYLMWIKTIDRLVD